LKFAFKEIFGESYPEALDMVTRKLEDKEFLSKLEKIIFAQTGNINTAKLFRGCSISAIIEQILVDLEVPLEKRDIVRMATLKQLLQYPWLESALALFSGGDCEHAD
jgi:hypothetical protein